MRYLNICQKCKKEFYTMTRVRSHCYLCNPFNISFKETQHPYFTEKLTGILEIITTGGTINGSNNAVFNTELSVNKVPAMDPINGNHRAEGWYIGVKLNAPEGYTSGGVYKSRSPRLDPANPAHEWDNLELKNFDEYKDGDYFIQLWPYLSPEFLNNYIQAGLNEIVYEYKFDWNNDGQYDQMITITIDPTKMILKSEDGSEQIYPILPEVEEAPTEGGESV